jgi:hypothetical protein
MLAENACQGIFSSLLRAFIFPLTSCHPISRADKKAAGFAFLEDFSLKVF